MRAKTLIAAGLVALAVAGCGSSGESDQASEVDWEVALPELPAPTSEARPSPIQRAVKQLEQQGAKAARGTTGVSDSDLLPSERGAEFLVDRGHVELDPLCAATKTEAEAERDPDLARELDAAGLDLGWGERAFLDGWKRVAPGRSEIGAGLYNALWVRCY